MANAGDFRKEQVPPNDFYHWGAGSSPAPGNNDLTGQGFRNNINAMQG